MDNNVFSKLDYQTKKIEEISKKIDDSVRITSQQMSADDLYKLGLMYINKKEYNIASNYFIQVRALDASRWYCAFLIGFCNAELINIETHIEDYKHDSLMNLNETYKYISTTVDKEKNVGLFFNLVNYVYLNLDADIFNYRGETCVTYNHYVTVVSLIYNEIIMLLFPERDKYNDYLENFTKRLVNLLMHAKIYVQKIDYDKLAFLCEKYKLPELKLCDYTDISQKNNVININRKIMHTSNDNIEKLTSLFPVIYEYNNKKYSLVRFVTIVVIGTFSLICGIVDFAFMSSFVGKYDYTPAIIFLIIFSLYYIIYAFITKYSIKCQTGLSIYKFKITYDKLTKSLAISKESSFLMRFCMTWITKISSFYLLCTYYLLAFENSFKGISTVLLILSLIDFIILFFIPLNPKIELNYNQLYFDINKEKYYLDLTVID